MNNYIIQILDGDKLLDVCMFKADSFEDGLEDRRIQEHISKYEDDKQIKIFENIPTPSFKRDMGFFKEVLKNKDIKIVMVYSKRIRHGVHA